MNLCIPVIEDLGLKSLVCGHFGSAPIFLVLDTDSGACTAIKNENEHHAHGGCQPLLALAGHSIDAIAVGGIGMGAMMKLMAGGIRVYMAAHPTVEETVAAFKSGTLQEADPSRACAHHGHGHDHGHEHEQGSHGPCGS